MIAHLVVDYTEIDMGQKLTRNISNFLMLSVELNGILVVTRVLFSHFHVVDTNAIVCECFTMDVTNCATHLQELFVLGNSLLVLAQIVVQDTR